MWKGAHRTRFKGGGEKGYSVWRKWKVTFQWVTIEGGLDCQMVFALDFEHWYAASWDLSSCLAQSPNFIRHCNWIDTAICLLNLWNRNLAEVGPIFFCKNDYLTKTILGSGCGAGGRAVASDTRGPGSNPVIGNFYWTFIYY